MRVVLGPFPAGRWRASQCHASFWGYTRIYQTTRQQRRLLDYGAGVFGDLRVRSNRRLISRSPASGPHSNPSYRKKEREPFEAELLVLFGLPALIILIPWALGDPSGLLIIPLVLLVPGPRDIILAVVRDAFLKMRKAKRFIKNEPSLGKSEEDTTSNPRSKVWKRRIKRPWKQRGSGKGGTVIELQPVQIAEKSDEPSPLPIAKSRKEKLSISDKSHLNVHNADKIYDAIDMAGSARSPKRKFKYRRTARSRLGYKGREEDFQRTYDDATETGTRRQQNNIAYRRRIPWFVRPLVTILPFMKDWGGFIS